MKLLQVLGITALLLGLNTVVTPLLGLPDGQFLLYILIAGLGVMYWKNTAYAPPSTPKKSLTADSVPELISLLKKEKITQQKKTLEQKNSALPNSSQEATLPPEKQDAFVPSSGASASTFKPPMCAFMFSLSEPKTYVIPGVMAAQGQVALPKEMHHLIKKTALMNMEKANPVKVLKPVNPSFLKKVLANQHHATYSEDAFNDPSILPLNLFSNN